MALAVLVAVILFLSVTLIAIVFVSYIGGVINGATSIGYIVTLLFALIGGVGWILQKVMATVILEWMGYG